MDFFQLKMNNRMTEFEEYTGNMSDIVGYEQITGHLLFGIKLGEYFHSKPIYCVGSHKTGQPPYLNYSTIVKQGYVRIIILIATLSKFSILRFDFQNTFLTWPNW